MALRTAKPRFNIMGSRTVEGRNVVTYVLTDCGRLLPAPRHLGRTV